MNNAAIADRYYIHVRNNYYSYRDKSQTFLRRNILLLPFQMVLAEQVVIYAQKSEQGDINSGTTKPGR